MKKEVSRQGRLAIMLLLLLLLLWLSFLSYWVLRTPGPALGQVVRIAALWGYTILFLSILSSEYIREMRKLFGQPFLRVHHVLAVAGLLLMLVHPLAYASWVGSLSVFVPIWTPVRSALALGGRQGLYLVWIAVLAALARRRLKDVWKFIHWLNYLAFALIFAHAWLLGQDIARGPLRAMWLVMALLVMAVLVHKRLLSRPKKA